MTDKDFQRQIAAIKQLLGMMPIPADEMHVGIVGQIYSLLNNMNDECDNRAKQAELSEKSKKAAQ